MSVLITGGAGFVGSHLAERFLSVGVDVIVADDLSNGRREWVPEQATFHQVDLRRDASIREVITDDVELVCHLASRKAVDDDRPRQQFQENTEMTYGLVEAMTDVGLDELIFTSSSTVYGEAPRPTPEDHAPLEPISPYGASKLSCEAILSVAAYSFGIRVTNVRFANIVGPRLSGAVIPDFIRKLRADPRTLTILGDGRQEKSYMHIEDCLDAMVHAHEHATGPMTTYNLGTSTTTSVTRIADIVAAELGVDPEYEYTGGKRGWVGDVPRMRLSIEKLSEIGWEPMLESDEAVERAARELATEL